MKATGIVRRIDDLGRVVIPKEIRRTMHIRDGDPLEIYTDREGEVIFKKYSPVGELNAFAGQYAETLHRTCELDVLICDRDTVIAYAGLPRRDFAEKPISSELEAILETRRLYVYNSGDRKCPATAEMTSEYFVSCAMPMITEGDLVGAVVSLVKNEPTSDRAKRDVEQKVIQTAAGFLGRQLES
ncbi:MAG: AbrB/MazE/SpoVT family DNA-binding domain-containing protein [Clostridia bacterium]|nr:AbrB/MazE/SpoVT family DNA-binding domain-containing protein [Clostridia bacterium]